MKIADIGRIGLIGLGLLTPTLAMAADAANGENIARRWCAFCHIVASDQRQGTEAKPFGDIANRPGFDAAQLALFLLNPHPPMPNMGLSRSEAADLAAYIASQRR